MLNHPLPKSSVGDHFNVNSIPINSNTIVADVIITNGKGYIAVTIVITTTTKTFALCRNLTLLADLE